MSVTRIREATLNFAPRNGSHLHAVLHVISSQPDRSGYTQI